MIWRCFALIAFYSPSSYLHIEYHNIQYWTSLHSIYNFGIRLLITISGALILHLCPNGTFFCFRNRYLCFGDFFRRIFSLSGIFLRYGNRPELWHSNSVYVAAFFVSRVTCRVLTIWHFKVWISAFYKADWNWMSFSGIFLVELHWIVLPRNSLNFIEKAHCKVCINALIV